MSHVRIFRNNHNKNYNHFQLKNTKFELYAIMNDKIVILYELYIMSSI